MKAMPNTLLRLASVSLFFAAHLGAAEARSIALSVTTEDGKKMLVGTLTAAGKPVENAKIGFFARRSFGDLSLGAEVTLDDGTAAVAFPSTLPGDEHGRLHLIAELANQPKGATRVRTETVFEGGVPFKIEPQTTPRALWSSRAPFILLVNIGILVGLVWAAFAYAVLQLWGIRWTAAAHSTASHPTSAGSPSQATS